MCGWRDGSDGPSEEEKGRSECRRVCVEETRGITQWMMAGEREQRGRAAGGREEEWSGGGWKWAVEKATPPAMTSFSASATVAIVESACLSTSSRLVLNARDPSAESEA